MNRKKILVLTDWFAPGYKAGGPIQSCVNFSHALKNDYDIYVLTTDTDHGEKESYPNIVSNQWLFNQEDGFHIYYVKKSSIRLSQLKQIIEEINADFIYLNHLFSPYFVIYPLWLAYMGRINAKVVLCPRGGLYDSALAVKSYKKRPYIQLLKLLKIQNKILFHATNQREADAIEKVFPNSRVMIADNLPNTHQLPFTSFPKTKGTLKAVFIARIVAIKNLLFILNALQEVKSAVQFTVIGPVEEMDYWNECKKKIAQLPPNIQVNYIGAKRNDELAAILSAHHLFILPTKGENFGHAIFESFLAGRPVLISDQTPWRNLSEKKIGWDLSLDHPEYYLDAVEKVAGFDQAEFDEWAYNAWLFAKDYISKPTLKADYLKLFY